MPLVCLRNNENAINEPIHCFQFRVKIVGYWFNGRLKLTAIKSHVAAKIPPTECNCQCPTPQPLLHLDITIATPSFIEIPSLPLQITSFLQVFGRWMLQAEGVLKGKAQLWQNQIFKAAIFSAHRSIFALLSPYL